jgi:hypothetical protein
VIGIKFHSSATGRNFGGKKRWAQKKTKKL